MSTSKQASVVLLAPRLLTPGKAPLQSHEQLQADQALDVFLTVVGGRSRLLEVLTIAGDDPVIDTVVNQLTSAPNGRSTLRSVCADYGITVVDLFRAYRRALLVRAHVHAAHLVADRLPAIVTEVLEAALGREILCPSCTGQPRDPARPCKSCGDTGKVRQAPSLDAQKLALELGGLIEKKGPAIQVNNQVNAPPPARETASDRLQQTASEWLFNKARQRKAAPQTVEATVEPSEPS